MDYERKNIRLEDRGLKKNLLFIGHEYHNKTKSTVFFSDILKQRYNVEFMTFDAETNEIKGDEEAYNKEYAVLVVFQMPIPRALLENSFTFKHKVYVPMYDGTGEAPNQFWLDYRDYNIINFSSTLHERLLKMGFSSYYIQYFPPAPEHIILGNKDKVFFWQRREIININTVCKLLSRSTVKRIHVHKVADPGEKYIEPSEVQKKVYHFSYSSWYEKKSDMMKDVEEAGIYIAPREYEGIGMSFLEAMAMGKCVIAPDHPTMNEYIRHGINGYLYDPHHVKPIHNMDVAKVQENAYQYMREGYENWERRKNDILKWVEKDVRINPQLMEKTYNERFILGKRYIAGKILLVTREEGEIYRLFGKIRLNSKLVSFLKRIRGRG